LENLATGIVADIPESQSSFKDDSDPYLDAIEETGLAKGVALQVIASVASSCIKLTPLLAGYAQQCFGGFSACVCAQRISHAIRGATWTRSV
jgi:hypothetical protein